MTIFVALVLTGLTFAFIVYPLFKRRSSSANSVGNEKLQELYSKQDATYAMPKKIEFDFQSGILTEEDYRDRETRYKRKAISINREIDGLEKTTELERKIERRILELRRSEGRFCHQCGVRYQESARFCSRCGTSLSKGERVD